MDLDRVSILPDSRLHETKGAKRIHFGPWGAINMVPIFCANCGTFGAYVPEENCTFAIWLCDHPCAEQWGPQYGAAAMPDEIFWEKVKQEQLDKYGRYLTPIELQTVAETSTSTLHTLLKESPIRTP